MGETKNKLLVIRVMMNKRLVFIFKMAISLNLMGNHERKITRLKTPVQI